MVSRFQIIEVASVSDQMKYEKTLEFYNETAYAKAGIPMNWHKVKKYVDLASKEGFCKGVIDLNGFKGVGAIIVLKTKNMFSDADALMDLSIFMTKEYREIPEARQAFEVLFDNFKVWAKANVPFPTITNTAGITDGGFFKKMGLEEVGQVYKIV